MIQEQFSEGIGDVVTKMGNLVKHADQEYICECYLEREVCA